MIPKVYFTRDINPEKAVELFKLINRPLKGNVAVKIHSGEMGNQNFLKPDFWEPIINHVGGTPVECNTAYDGSRSTLERHMDTLKKHGWTEYFNTEIMDAEKPDIELDVKNGKILTKNFVGKGLGKYDSLLVLSHFKGHPMGGYGGALKQLSIGIASSYGKANIHGAGDAKNLWSSDHDEFLASMADAASSVIDRFGENVVYINVMKNMSVDCDCCAVAEDPCMKDIGILASTDPVAIDQACIDLVYNSDDPGRDHLIERIESRNGIYTIECAAEIGCGSREYELVEV